MNILEPINPLRISFLGINIWGEGSLDISEEEKKNDELIAKNFKIQGNFKSTDQKTSSPMHKKIEENLIKDYNLIA